MNFGPVVALVIVLPCWEAEPPVRLTDLNAFPPAAVARLNYETAQKHREWLWTRPPWMTPEEREAWSDDAAWCHRAWDALDDAAGFLESRSGLGWWPWDRSQLDARRLQQLERLRDLIGPEDYYAGRMPPPVPLWRLPRRD